MNFFSQIFFEFLVFCRYCWQDLVEFLPISKKEFKNSLIRPFFGRSKMSRVLSARARARARPSCSTGASGPFDDRRLRSTTFRARATFKKYILSLGSFFYFCVNYILFCLNCVQMFYNLFNFSRVFNLTLCVPPGKITQSWKKTRARARAPLFEIANSSQKIWYWKRF